MVKATVEQLCKQHTDLTDQDIQILQEMAVGLQTYADLSSSYMFIDCKLKPSNQAIVVAEAFPNSSAPLYDNSVVGKIVFESFEPGVFYSYRKGKKSIIRQAMTQEGKVVDQTVVPIKNACHQVIGVLIQEKEVTLSLSDDHVKKFSVITGTEEDRMTNSGLGIVSDLLMEMLILTDSNDRLVYANPSGLKLISEMSGHDEVLNRNLLDMLPFLRPVYEHHDDVFVFELTIQRKNLIVKKIKMHEKSNPQETLLIIQDITELRTKEKELMMKSVVIKEIHHRVKNNLQTVASLIRLQMRNGLPIESRASFEETLNRIYSISSVYEIILTKEHADDDDVNIINLTRKICSTMVLNEYNLKVDLIIEPNGNKIITTSKKAVSVALIINELIQNSLKHAFQGKEEGVIDVEFTVENDFVELHVSDNGVGMKDPQTSLGTEIIHNLVTNDLNGEFLYVPREIGTHAVIIFPVGAEVEIFDEKTDRYSGR
ncbi:PAS domain-containing sensor histidine kinase [Sporosarcina sp. GW1-11]|uniref:PAS domain-containing sensor histidine kinase n=1 Tax=Sporosarcina sp. GW1-11 TaxID=2899126 RepID=UPI00294C5515|nr:PAS domain-containing sensor histidine kinase [Sporosarcina sp. GW1-11]MDV6379364.1 PAS domain-containing sensor histidine kinase [Sporosarcina sp. GW1-11]